MNRKNAFTETPLREAPCHSEGKARRIWLSFPRRRESSPCERQRNNLAFTLVELLTVIAIMTLLAGLLLPALTKAREKAKVAKCISTIASLQTALSMYQVDYGMYPPSSNNATQHNGNSANSVVFDGTPNNLVAALTDQSGSGPYMEFKAGDLAKVQGSDPPVLLDPPVLKDPWGQAYIYVSRKYEPGNDTSTSHGPFHPDTTDPENNTYNIYSLGPDKKTYGGDDYPSGTDWDESSLFDDDEDGDFQNGGHANCDDDINSWDGSRSF